MSVSSIAVHMDSAPGEQGIVYSQALFRLCNIFEAKNIKATFFVLGKDMEEPSVRRRVRALHRQGHEIANHSYNHLRDLAGRPKQLIEKEIMLAHEKITLAAGCEPEGFCSPAWGSSKTLRGVLIEKGYSYDSSFLPLWGGYILRGYLLLRSRGGCPLNFKKAKSYFSGSRIFRRRGRRIENSQHIELKVFPVPTTPGLGFPCWHSLAFLFPSALFEKLLERALLNENFIYVLHPQDILSPGDYKGIDYNPVFMKRYRTSLKKKKKLLGDALDTVTGNTSSTLTLRELAEF